MRLAPSWAGTLIASLCVIALALPVSSASALSETTAITDPAGPISYPLYDETAPGAPITIEGSSSGIAAKAVDIRCYGPPQFDTPNELLAADVPVKAGGAFSVQVEPKALQYLPLCALRAVPTGTTPPLSETAFSGPDIAPTTWEADQSGYYVDTSTLTSNLWFQSATGCALEETFLYPAPGQASPELFSCDAALLGTNGWRSDIQIDGQNAYGPGSAMALEETLGRTIPGAPQITVEKRFSEADGELEIHESDPLVRCSANTFPPTLASCTSFIPVGVTLQRTWSTQDEEHVVLMSDTWRSTDGAPHGLSARYYTALQYAARGEGVVDFPGSAGFASTAAGESVTLPAGPGVILYKASAGDSEAGNGHDAQGAVAYQSQPSEPLAIDAGGSESVYTAAEVPYTHTIPPTGSYNLRMAYVQYFGLPEVRAAAAAALAGFPAASTGPSLAVASPASGATLSTPSVLVSGSATDSVPVSSVTVDGAAVSSRAGTGWATTVPLQLGANTITVTAGDAEGYEATRTITVTYAPPGTTAAASASRVGAVHASKGQVSFTAACHGAAGTLCTILAGLVTVERTRHGRLIGVIAATRSRMVTLATSAVVIPAGRTQKITLRLNLTGRRLLARFGELPARLSVLQEGEGRHHTILIDQNLTVRRPKPAPKRARRRA